MDQQNDSLPRLRFAQLPALAKLAVGLALFNSWVIFEEGIVDRLGVWQYLPGYVKARFCPWDLAAAGLIFVPLLLLPRWRRQAQEASNRPHQVG
jgi:hypothetical protein